MFTIKPLNPNYGDLYYDEGKIMVYNGNNWQEFIFHSNLSFLSKKGKRLEKIKRLFN